MTGADYDTSLVGDMGDLGSVCDQLYMAVRTRETLGRGLLDMRSGDNALRDAGSGQVICECGRPLKTEDRGHHVVATCCGQVLEGCCGDV